MSRMKQDFVGNGCLEKQIDTVETVSAGDEAVDTKLHLD